MQLILLRGLPGSGKTTLARALTPNNFCADDFWSYDYTHDSRGFDLDELRAAHNRCRLAVMSALNNKASPVVVHNTFTTDKEVNDYISLGKSYGYEVHTVIVENRHHSESEHNVPKSTLEKMRKRFTIEL